MCSQSTLVHEDKQHGTFREVAELFSELVQSENDNGVTRNRLDLGSGHFGPFFFPGRGVKSRLQCWGCMCPALRAMTKNMGHSFTHTHMHTLFSLSPSLYLQLSSQ